MASFSLDRSRLNRYGVAVIAIVAATLVRMLLDPVLGGSAPYTTYFGAVMLAAWYGGAGSAVLVLGSGALLADYLFIEPRRNIFLFDWVPYHIEHQINILLFLAVGVVMITLSHSLRASQKRSEEARDQLAEANRELKNEIAEREKTEQWLLESECRFRGCFEQSLFGMALLSPEKDFIEANLRLAQLLGYSVEELTMKTWTQVTCPEDLAAEEERFARMLRGIVKGYAIDKRFLRKGGQAVRANVSVQCLRKENGTIDGILVLAQDTSDRNRAEEPALAVSVTAVQHGTP